jgi:hypothetical protein
MTQFSRKCSIPFFLIVWFFIWGICPWSSSSAAAQAAEAAHAKHGHHGEAGDTHHASKGTEHSCTGSISYSKGDDGSDRVLDFTGPTLDPSHLSGPAALSDRPYFFGATFLPKRLTHLYHLYVVYRI